MSFAAEASRAFGAFEVPLASVHRPQMRLGKSMICLSQQNHLDIRFVYKRFVALGARKALRDVLFAGRHRCQLARLCVEHTCRLRLEETRRRAQPTTRNSSSRRSVVGCAPPRSLQVKAKPYTTTGNRIVMQSCDLIMAGSVGRGASTPLVPSVLDED